VNEETSAEFPVQMRRERTRLTPSACAPSEGGIADDVRQELF
jgi:hypothetical protein